MIYLYAVILIIGPYVGTHVLVILLDGVILICEMVHMTLSLFIWYFNT